MAARAARKGIVAKGRVHKFHARFKRVGIDMLWLAQVAQLKQIAVVEVGDALGQCFHQNARGARVADVEHQINIHRSIAVGIDNLRGQIADRKAHNLKPCEVKGQMLKHIGIIFVPCPAPLVLRLLPAIVEAVKPFVHPGGIEKPRIVAHKVGQHKMPVSGHILRRKRVVLLALGGAVFHIGVKHDHHAQLAGVFV